MINNIKKPVYHFSKRAIDLAFSVIALLITFPIIILLYILVRLYLGAPVFFKQLRPGLNGQPFYFYKFRTMLDSTNIHGNLCPDSERLTKFGSWLRRTSLDELPQFWNVLKGDISLIGPRPLLMVYLKRYSTEQARRHEVKPGITGWAQINGRNSIDWERKLALDVFYVDHCGFAIDCKILLLTIWKVLRREGINQSG